MPTANDCCTCDAAFQLPFPAWFASITQVPTVRKLTTPAEIEQTELAEASIVNETASPEDAVAAGVYDAPATFAAPGADEVNEIVWSPFTSTELEPLVDVQERHFVTTVYEYVTGAPLEGAVSVQLVLAMGAAELPQATLEGEPFRST